MIRVDPHEIRSLRETQTVEFKTSLSLHKEALRALCGMINSESATGTVFFGVSPDGAIVGVDPRSSDSNQRTLAQKVRQLFDPPIISVIEVLECDNKHVMRLKADRASGVPYHECDGRAYIREGSTTRQLSYQEKQQLSKRRDRDQHGGPWKCDRCGKVVGILIGMTITHERVHKSYACGCGGEYWPVS